MKLFFSFFLMMIVPACYCQEIIPIRETDTLIPFFGKKPLRLNEYENRVIPFDDKNPLHVLITFKNSSVANFEYFRIDSTTYLVQEYFPDGKLSSNGGVKSVGIKTVKNEIIDSSATIGISAASSEIRRSKYIHYFLKFTKEGQWTEYDDSTFEQSYWTGIYKDDKRTGIWKHYINGLGSEFLLEEIDYSKKIPRPFFSVNLARNTTVDSLKSMISGVWHLRSCDEEKSQRMAFVNCKENLTADGYTCSNFFINENFYDFSLPDKFRRTRGDGCYKFREQQISGKWILTKKDDFYFIEITFPNNKVWTLKILYLDSELNIMTERT